MRLRPWILALAMLGCCALVLSLLEWRRRAADFSNETLLAHMPDNEGSNVFLDINALRISGLLDNIAGKRAEEEPEYQAFTRETGFDYRDDLDAVVAHFNVDSQLFLLRGRFSWQQISRHMRASGGDCLNGVCWMQLSRGRYLSALPMASNVLALGTGTYKNVVYSVLPVRTQPIPKLPQDPLWAELSEEFLRNPRRLPEGTRAFLTAVKDARSVFLSVSPSQERGLEAHMRATFKSSEEAAACRTRLEQATSMLQKFFDLDRQKATSGELSSALVAGKFAQDQSTVQGNWPLGRGLFEQVVSGN